MAVRELESPPSLAALYPKAVAGTGLSALRRLPGLGGDGSAELPDEELVLRDHEIDLEQRRPIRDDERLDMRVRTDNLGPHDRGTQFEVIAEATVGGEPAWRSVSTY